MSNDNLKDREGLGGLSKSLLIGTPMAIGAHVSLRQYYENRWNLNEPINPISSKPYSGLAAIVQNYHTFHNPAARSWQVSKFGKLAQDSPLAKDDVLDIVRRHVGVNDPTGKLASILEERLTSARTGQEAIENLQEFVKNSDSIYVQRTGASILEDLEITTKRAEIGLPTKSTRLASRVPRQFTDINPAMLDPKMRKDIFRVAEELGAQVSIKEMSRADLPGAELHVKYSHSNKFAGDFTLRLPREIKPGVIVHGTTQQSRYLAGMYGIVHEGKLLESFNHEQYMMRRAAEDLVPQILHSKQINQRHIRELANQFSQKMLEDPEWFASIEFGKHPGLEKYTDWRSQIMRLRTPTGLPIDEFEQYKIMLKGGLETPEGLMRVFPGYSPTQIAGGTVSTADIREASFMVPEAAPWGRRPGQWLRSAATPTEAAVAAIAADPVSQRFGQFATAAGVPAPMVRTAFMSSEHIPTLAGTGVSPEGQFLLSKRLDPQRAVKVWKQFDISSKQIQDLAQVIDIEGTAASVQKITQQLPEGALLGYSPKGKPVILPPDTELIHAAMFEKDRAKGDFIRVMGLETIKEKEAAKYFGIKGMASVKEEDYLDKVLIERGKMSMKEIYRHGGIDAIMMMDELKKNRALHYNQIFTSLWDYTKQNMDSGKSVSTLTSNFAKDPYKVIGQFRTAARQGDMFSHEVMMKSIMGIARDAQLNPEQMGRVFGAVPEIFGGLDVLGDLTLAEKGQIKRGIAYGTTQLFFESSFGPGSGKAATIEPRGFSMLSGPQYGAVGRELQEDIAQRMMTAYPERLIEQRELATSLRSIRELKPRTGSIDPTSILKSLAGDTDLLIPETPTSMRIRGVGDIYMPGGRQLAQLASYQTATGAAIDSPLALSYRNLIETASGFETGKIRREQLNLALERTQIEVARSWAGTVTEKGGLLSGRVPGSMFLTALEPTRDEAFLLRQSGPNVVGITDPYAKQMFKRMEDLGIYESKEIEHMRQTWEKHKTVPGLAGRHPHTGPFSYQPVHFQHVAGDDPIALIAERRERAIAFEGQLNEEKMANYKAGARKAFAGHQKAINRLQSLGGEMLGNPLRLSPLVGLAGDVDGDIISAMFAGPQTRKTLTDFIDSDHWNKYYQEHQIRIQLLKSKATQDTLTIASMMKMTAGDVAKLGIPEGGRLGKLSLAFHEYKSALFSGAKKLSAKETLDSLALLEWMEQVPISSKHIKPGEELKLIHTLDDMLEAVYKKSAPDIAQSVRNVMVHAKASGHAIMEDKGVTVFLEDAMTGKVRSQYIPALNISRAVENLVGAKKAHEATAIGRTTAAALEKAVMGRGKITPDIIDTMLTPGSMKDSPIGTLLSSSTEGFQPPGGLGRQISTEALSISNKVAALGKRAIGAAKPLLIGTAAALGIATFLSAPPRSLSVENAQVTPNLASGSGGAKMPGNIHPDSQVQGQPTAQNLVGSMNNARLALNTNNSYHIKIRGASNQQVDIQGISEQLRQAVGNNARIDSTTRDMRSTLTPQRLSSIINGD